MTIAGITGGLGCGKSTVARLMEQHGFRRLDSDAIMRERVLVAPDVVAALRAHFGAAVVAPDGTVNRAALAQRVFEDDAELRWLEELTHPRLFAIRREM